MKIIRYVDLVENVEGEDGEYYSEVTKTDFTLPIIIDAGRIDFICPFYTSTGRVFKNVSVIKYDNELLKVVGNYKDLNNLRYRRGPIGFINGEQKKEATKDRTKIKSKSKRRTKGSNT